MIVRIDITEMEVKALITDHIRSTMGDRGFDPNNVKIYVKSKQNYKSEWEEASIKAEYHEKS